MSTRSLPLRRHQYGFPGGWVRGSLRIVAALLLAACAPVPIDLTATGTIPQNEGVAFGRVKLISDGETQNLSTIFGESELSVFVLPDNSSNAIRFPLKDQGWFFWHLAPGDYTIASFEGVTPGFFSISMKGRIFAHFDVVEDTVTYVGTLGILLEGPGYVVFVEDEYSTALQELRMRFPALTAEARKAPMTLEEPR